MAPGHPATDLANQRQDFEKEVQAAEHLQTGRSDSVIMGGESKTRCWLLALPWCCVNQRVLGHLCHTISEHDPASAIAGKSSMQQLCHGFVVLWWLPASSSTVSCNYYNCYCCCRCCSCFLGNAGCGCCCCCRRSFLLRHCSYYHCCYQTTPATPPPAAAPRTTRTARTRTTTTPKTVTTTIMNGNHTMIAADAVLGCHCHSCDDCYHHHSDNVCHDYLGYKRYDYCPHGPSHASRVIPTTLLL